MGIPECILALCSYILSRHQSSAVITHCPPSDNRPISTARPHVRSNIFCSEAGETHHESQVWRSGPVAAMFSEAKTPWPRPADPYERGWQGQRRVLGATRQPAPTIPVNAIPQPTREPKALKS